MTKPVQLIAFNRGHKLVAAFCSYCDAAKIVGVSRQAISNCAKGRKIVCSDLYWRELDPDIMIDSDDLDSLTLPEYDRMVELKRKGYKPWKNGKENTIIISEYYPKSNNKQQSWKKSK